MKVRQLLLALVLLIISSAYCLSAEKVTLSWDANDPIPNEGYAVYQTEEGTPFDYTTFVWEGHETTCEITGLDNCKKYIFVVRAKACGNQSVDSNVVTTVVTAPEAPTNLVQ